jgi:hypothetical protein
MRAPLSHCGRFLLVLAAGVACFSGDVAVLQPSASGTVRTTLAIVAGTQEDSGLAAQLGWHGAIPGALVVIAPMDTTLPPVRQLVADSAGTAPVDSLEPGTYWIDVKRVLTDAERSHVPARSDLLGFARRTMMTLSGGTPRTSVASYAIRQRSLLISEWSFVPGLLPGVTGYDLGGFLELYNNSDTTVYLDGLILAQGIAQYIETLPQSCAQAASLFMDPLGVWARKFDQFPGSGHDYPLAPGKTVVIATDAIDHRPIIADGLDLRAADFEFTGPNDVDNPDVPNMLDRGLGPDLSGHGTITGTIADVLTLVPPIDLDALPRKLGLTGTEYRRVPREQLLDAMAFRVYNNGRYQTCSRLVDPAIVRDQANLDYALDAHYGFIHSVNRRVLFERDGRKILEDTRSGTTDLIVAPRTPGRIP